MSAINIKVALQDAGYRTHQVQSANRCEKCTHVLPGRKQHGRRCLHLQADVVSHGVCCHFTAPAPVKHEIRVKDAGGAYTTNLVLARRASCTHSATAAAERLAGKLALSKTWTLTEVGREGNVTVFELEIQP